MTTRAFALVSGVAQVLLTGRYIIRNVWWEAAGAGNATLVDNDNASLTQSNPSYVDGAITNPYTRTVYGVRALNCTTYDYNFTGQSTAYSTQAADPSFALPPIAVLPLAGAGVFGPVDVQAVIALGLTAQSTVNGNLIVTYDTAV